MASHWWPWLSSEDCAHLLQASSRPGHPGQRDEALLMAWLLRKERAFPWSRTGSHRWHSVSSSLAVSEDKGFEGMQRGSG